MRIHLVASRTLLSAFVLSALFLASSVAKAETDVSKLYEVEMTATPNVVNGEAGELLVRIQPKEGAEIHKEAPISLSLEMKGVKTSKSKLGRPDLAMEGENGAFRVPFTAVSPGSATIDANLTFFVCTDNLCARQQRKARIPVNVGG